MFETENRKNRIVFQDVKGIPHDIPIKRITKFRKLTFRYGIWFVKTDGITDSCSLDDDDPANYVVYRGIKYTGDGFRKLVLAIENENNLVAIEELE